MTVVIRLRSSVNWQFVLDAIAIIVVLSDCMVRCTPDICGDHGDCEIVNGTYIVCSCRDYYDGPNCEIC